MMFEFFFSSTHRRRQMSWKSPAQENGSITILTAFAMVVLLGFAALTIDVGFFFRTERGVQNDADAMALATVRELPDEDAARNIATEWAIKNAVETAEIKGIVFGENCSHTKIEGTVTVRLVRNQETFLANILGVSDANLSGCATARIGWARGGPDLLPFGLLYDEPDPPVAADPPLCFYNNNPNLWEVECTIKVPKPNETWTPGNSGPLRLDDNSGVDPDNWQADCEGSNSGANEYKQNIRDGSECGYAPGDQIQTKTGSMAGPTCTELGIRLQGNTDTFEDVFSEPDEDGVYQTVDESSARFGIIPVVIIPEGAAGSSTNVEIYTFVTVYLVGCADDSGPAVVSVIPAQSETYVEGVDFVEGSSGDYSTDWPLNTIKLVQ